MHNKGKAIINQSIPNEFSSTLIKYKVEHNPNIHYNYNLAEITAMREERIRENKETQKRQQISDCIKNCKQNIAKYNQENQSKINESISSVQRGKEYNENLRKQMKLKAEMKKRNKEKEKEIDIKNYGEEMIPTFSFKEQTEELDENGKIMYKEFYQNNNFSNSNENNKENNNVIDVSKNILSQMQENSEITNSHMINNSGMNFNANIIGNNISNNKNKNLENKDMNIQKKINNNIEMIQKFRKTGAIFNNQENDIMNENNLDNNDEQNLPQPEPLLIKGNAPIKNANNFFRTQNIMSQQDLNINDISSIKSGVNFSTNLHMNTNNSNYFINETNIQPI